MVGGAQSNASVQSCRAEGKCTAAPNQSFNAVDCALSHPHRGI